MHGWNGHPRSYKSRNIQSFWVTKLKISLKLINTSQNISIFCPKMKGDLPLTCLVQLEHRRLVLLKTASSSDNTLSCWCNKSRRDIFAEHQGSFNQSIKTVFVSQRFHTPGGASKKDMKTTLVFLLLVAVTRMYNVFHLFFYLFLKS